MNISKSHIIPVIIALLASCSSSMSNDTDAENADSASVETDDGIIRINEQKNSTKISLGGAEYTCDISFVNDKEAPIITDVQGYRYSDNYADITITRGQTSILKKTIRKSFFSDMLTSSYLKNSALLAFCFNERKSKEKSGLYFIATIGNPDIASENSRSFEIRISTDGTISSISSFDDEELEYDSSIRYEDPEFEPEDNSYQESIVEE